MIIGLYKATETFVHFTIDYNLKIRQIQVLISPLYLPLLLIFFLCKTAIFYSNGIWNFARIC